MLTAAHLERYDHLELNGKLTTLLMVKYRHQYRRGEANGRAAVLSESRR